MKESLKNEIPFLLKTQMVLHLIALVLSYWIVIDQITNNLKAEPEFRKYKGIDIKEF